MALHRFLTDEDGASAVEYALIATLVGVGIIAGLSNFGTALNGKFKFVAETVNPVFGS